MKSNHAPFMCFADIGLREAPVIRHFLPVDDASSLQPPCDDSSIVIHPDANVRCPICEELHAPRACKLERVGFCQHGHFGHSDLHVVCPQLLQHICVTML